MRDPRRFLWLDERDRGKSTAAIARRYNVPQRTIQNEIGLAQAEVAAFVESRRMMPAPHLVPFFPINGLFPKSRCRHDMVPIPRGSVFCCAVCHRSGMDHHPALQRYPRLDPRPDPTPYAEPNHGTRRQRRARLLDQPGRAESLQAA